MEKAEVADKIIDIDYDAEGSSLNMILKSLWQISVFARQNNVRHDFTGSFLKEDILRLSFINNLSLSKPLETNNVFDLFVYILDNFPPWNPYFEVYEVAKKSCNRCKMGMEYSIKPSYGMIINAGSLREDKVCSHGDRYNCVAYENNRWVRRFGSETEVIGDWNGVLSKFRNLHIRPEILFFENAMQRD